MPSTSTTRVDESGLQEAYSTLVRQHPKNRDRSDKTMSSKKRKILKFLEHRGTVSGRHEGVERRHRTQGRTELSRQVEDTAMVMAAASIAGLPWSTGSLAHNNVM